MGWKPHEVYSVSNAEFLTCWGGWQKVHCVSDGVEPATRDELDELLRRYG